jgi:hypothetical protein
MVSFVLVAAIRSPEGLTPGPTPTGNPDPACAPIPPGTPAPTRTPAPAPMPTPTGMTPAPAAAPAAATMPSPATMPTRPVAPRVSGSKIGRSRKSNKRKGNNHQQPACHHTSFSDRPISTEPRGGCRSSSCDTTIGGAPGLSSVEFLDGSNYFGVSPPPAPPTPRDETRGKLMVAWLSATGIEVGCSMV